MTLFLEGFIDFRKRENYFCQESRPLKDCIKLEGGYLYHGDLSNLKDSTYLFVVGTNKKYNGVVECVSNNKLDTFSSPFFFDNLLQSHNNSYIGIGVWYDEEQNLIKVARELFGLFPVYYVYQPHEFFAFSTSLARLVEFSKRQATASINYRKVYSLLGATTDSIANYNPQTFYNEIHSVLPGHVLSIEPNKISSKSYCTFKPVVTSPSYSVKEYGYDLREALIEAVKKNVGNSANILGSHLSGGLDSSSVSTLVRHLYPTKLLHTLYYNTADNTSPDRHYSSLVANHIGSQHHEVIVSKDDLHIVQLQVALMGTPVAKYTSPTFQHSLMELAANLGCEMLFNGNDGDSIVGSGLEMMEQFYKDKNWLVLKEMLTKRASFFSRGSHFDNWESLPFERKKYLVEQNFFYNRLVSHFKTSGFQQVFSSFKEINSHFELSVSYILGRTLKNIQHRLYTTSKHPMSVVKDDFIDSTAPYTSNVTLSESLGVGLSEEQVQNINYVYYDQGINQNEERFFLTQHFGLLSRSPFYDKQVFELCMAIPEVVKFGNGEGRLHLREAMKGLLQEDTRLRHNKESMGSQGRLSVLRLYHQAEELLMDSKEVWEIVDKNKFAKVVKFLKYSNLPIYEYNRSMFLVTRTISLAVWLNWLRSNP